FTIKTEPIAPIDLMERAASLFAEKLINETDLDSFCEIVVVCGPGKNGGDGLVIARYLAQTHKVLVVDSCFDSKPCEEFIINYALIEGNSNVTIVKADQFIQESYPSTPLFFPLIIDALFGIGISRKLEGSFEKLVHYINQINGYVVAVDVPSGLLCDEHTPDDYVSVFAHQVYTFQFPKLAFLLPENSIRLLSFSVIDIGLLIPPFISFNKKLINEEVASLLLHSRALFSHKGTFGHGLLIAGSSKMPGAALIGAVAAVRGGLGKLTVHAPSKVLDALTPYLPEAIHSIDENVECFSGIADPIEQFQSIAIGPGLGTEKLTMEAFERLLIQIKDAQTSIPLVIDADALNMVSKAPHLQKLIPPYTILTPHFKEFERLLGPVENDFHRLEKLKEFAQEYQLIVVLKGYYSVVALPSGELFFNQSGNSGMATAGSGDLLTGLILSLLAQKYHPHDAALLGVYIHGRAADFAVQDRHSEESLIASDIASYFGVAFKSLRK
ncbi:MAG TPA: NAD(P)H-hydrate dehydratase, partial [Bacteroidales bacterium]|nr:NAD(P)H-hydrate dehydratase [Bacteroidales bacterium]